MAPVYGWWTSQRKSELYDCEVKIFLYLQLVLCSLRIKNQRWGKTENKQQNCAIIIIVHIFRFARSIRRARPNLYKDDAEELPTTEIKWDKGMSANLYYWRSILEDGIRQWNSKRKVRVRWCETKNRILEYKTIQRFQGLFSGSGLRVISRLSALKSCIARHGRSSKADAYIWPESPNDKC